jgi:hypothetical protein
MYAHCGCALLWSVQLLPLLSLNALPPAPRFSTHPSILYLHILCYTILLMLYHFLFLSLFP